MAFTVAVNFGGVVSNEVMILSLPAETTNPEKIKDLAKKGKVKKLALRADKIVTMQCGFIGRINSVQVISSQREAIAILKGELTPQS